MTGYASVKVKASRKDCFVASSYENISLWSKMFSNGRVVENKEGAAIYACDAKILWFKFRAKVTGKIDPYSLIEETIELDDGSITKETMTYTSVSGGTKIEWRGRVVKAGKSLGLFGPLLNIAFPLSVRSDFKNFKRFVESGEYKNHKSSLFSK